MPQPINVSKMSSTLNGNGIANGGNGGTSGIVGSGGASGNNNSGHLINSGSGTSSVLSLGGSSNPAVTGSGRKYQCKMCPQVGFSQRFFMKIFKYYKCKSVKEVRVRGEIVNITRNSSISMRLRLIESVVVFVEYLRKICGKSTDSSGKFNFSCRKTNFLIL